MAEDLLEDDNRIDTHQRYQRTHDNHITNVEGTGKKMQQATLSMDGQIVKPVLTDEQTAFIQEWIVKLDPVQQTGAMQIVIDSGAGQKNEHGAFEFDLMTLPYKVCLSILKYVQQQARPLQKQELKRQKELERDSKKKGSSGRTSKRQPMGDATPSLPMTVEEKMDAL